MTGADVRRSYALVRTVRPDIELETWQAHIERVQNSAGADPIQAGAIALVCPQSYVYGTFTYATRRIPGAGPRLQVDDFCAAALSDRQASTDALLEAADALAHRHGCQSVCLNFLDNAADDHLQRAALGIGTSFSELPAAANMIP